MADDSGSSVVGEHPVSDLSDNSDRENPQEHEEHVVHDSSEDEQGHVVGRKHCEKVPEPTKWKRNIAKRRRNEGKKYVSAKTGKTVETRKIGPACIDGCFTRVTMDVVKNIFDKF